MFEANSREINGAKKLIRSVRKRMLHRLLVEMITLFTVAGLAIASIPLLAGKMNPQSPWVLTWLPTFAMVFSIFLGALATYFCRPSLEDAARKIDSSVKTNELFLTSLNTFKRRSDSAIFRLFCQDLGRATLPLKPRQIVPPRLAPALKFMLVLLAVDAVLLATPGKKAPQSVLVERAQQHLAWTTADEKSMSAETRIALEALRQAKTANELDQEAKKLWQSMTEAKTKSQKALANSLSELKSAIGDKNVKRSNEVMSQINNQLSSTPFADVKEESMREIDKLAKSTNDKDLAGRLTIIGKDSAGHGAGAGKSRLENAARKRSNVMEQQEFLEDVLISIFNTLGSSLPLNDADSKKSNGSSPQSSYSSSFPTRAQLSALALEPSDKKTVLRYFDLRRSR